MGGKEDRLVAQRQYFVENTVILQPGDLPVPVREEIGTTDRADKKQISGKNGQGLIAVAGVPKDQ